MVGQWKREIKDDAPVFGRNWFDAVTYCRWLSAQSGIAEAQQCYDDPTTLQQDEQGNPKYEELYLNRSGFRLPTEAEWEVVSRAGASTAYSFGNDVMSFGDYGWFRENSNEWSHATAELRPNLRGLFDVHGNLSEWCHNWYANKDVETIIEADPVGPNRGSYRVSRGGSWLLTAPNCRSANRDSNAPTFRAYGMGFRLALSPSSESSVQVAKPSDVGTE